MFGEWDTQRPRVDDLQGASEVGNARTAKSALCRAYVARTWEEKISGLDMAELCTGHYVFDIQKPNLLGMQKWSVALVVQGLAWVT